MASFTYNDIFAMKGRGIAQSAMTADQRRVAYQLRQHPDYTLHEAKEAAGVIKPQYTKADLEKMAAETPWEELTPAQKKLMKGIADEPVTPAKIAYYTGIPLSEINKAIHMKRYGGVDSGSLVYKASRGFFGKTNISRTAVILYGRKSDVEDYITMDSPQNIEKTIRENIPCPSPPCDDEEAVTTWIPIKNNAERTNIESAKGLAA